MAPIRLLIVDDSVFMRKTLRKILTGPDIVVVDEAVNGEQGVEKVAKLKPDVVTMDVEMPVMNGLEAVKTIMRTNPTPVIMISSLTSDGADATIEALSNGAMDFITKKPAFADMLALKEELIKKIKTLAQNSPARKKQVLHKSISQTGRIKERIQEQIESSIAERLRKKALKLKYDSRKAGKRPTKDSIRAVGIGVSTGGPASLGELFRGLPKEIPVPIFIAQHMPPHFTKSLAERLDNLSQLRVVEAEDNQLVARGCAYVAPGGKQMRVTRQMKTKITEEPNHLYNPSVDTLFDSLLNVYGKNYIGVIMTGMGSDGTNALKALHEKGGYVVSQDNETSVVAGMTKSVINAGIADEIHPLKDLSGVIASLFGLAAVC